MARSRSEAAFNEATRKQEADNAPLPVQPSEPPDTRPPLSHSQLAQREAEMQAGSEAVARAEAEHQRIQGILAKQRAAALEEGKTSPDDLS